MKELLPTEQQTCNALDCVSICFFLGGGSATDRSCFEMTEKTLFNLVIMTFSVMEKSNKMKK